MPRYFLIAEYYEYYEYYGKTMLKILKMSSLLGQSQLYIYNILYIL